ncbi:hypothetical protein SCLARK_001431 [Spiroplasma clarkii]|uniref:hypothetical protein n=1 Tax=Spiroplasma clarkii TaxID=2139 RepID=UPI000B56C884|nr:hypothetical protein [Spiroplasma clarkii]ARU91954.1 hypothetical protein SCLARK_001431 [Spiroplasma clarkii]
MASGKKATTVTKNSSESTSEKGYVWQHFTPKSLALVHKYNLQNDENYKKLLSSYDRIESLPDSDSRKINLVELWEVEFNRLFKHFWKNYSSESKKIDKGISGWKDRLDVRQEPTTPDAKRQVFMSRLSTSQSSNRNTREEILNRAGYKTDIDVEQFNFTAQPKTGKNIMEIENLLNDAESNGLGMPESILSNKASTDTSSTLRYNEVPETDNLTSSPVPDPSLEDFVNDTDSFVREAATLTDTTPKHGFVIDEDMTREEFNTVNNIDFDEAEIEQVPTSELAEPEVTLGIDFFQSALNPEAQTTEYQYVNSPINKYMYEGDLGIDPSKRNIHSKEGFEITTNPDKMPAVGQAFESEVSVGSKPYHEIKPIGNYQVSVDLSKRPAMQEILDNNQQEIKTLDEMTEKIEFLRELRNERRHRITMMKLERSNSYIVARARRMAEARELNRAKKREDINLKAIEKADRLRRLHERQRLIELMKERQIKRAEEKRVASVLRLERQRRFERDAKYRSEIASIDAQIRHEQEMIKRTELKMKAYFTKANDDRVFDESLVAAKKTYKFIELEKRAETVAKIENEKRKNRIEKLVENSQKI